MDEKQKSPELLGLEQMERHPEELLPLFLRRQVFDASGDVQAVLDQAGYPHRSAITSLDFDREPVLDRRFVKDGFIYLLRGDHPNQVQNGFYSRCYACGLTTQKITETLKNPREVPWYLYNDSRYANAEPFSDSIAEQLAYWQSQVGGSSFISLTSNLPCAIAGTGNQPTKEEQESYQVYVVKIPLEAVIQRSPRIGVVGMDEEEYLVPDYISTEEVVGAFSRDDIDGVTKYFHDELGLSPEDLGVEFS